MPKLNATQKLYVLVAPDGLIGEFGISEKPAVRTAMLRRRGVLHVVFEF